MMSSRVLSSRVLSDFSGETVKSVAIFFIASTKIERGFRSVVSTIRDIICSSLQFREVNFLMGVVAVIESRVKVMFSDSLWLRSRIIVIFGSKVAKVMQK